MHYFILNAIKFVISVLPMMHMASWLLYVIALVYRNISLCFQDAFMILDILSVLIYLEVYFFHINLNVWTNKMKEIYHHIMFHFWTDLRPLESMSVTSTSMDYGCHWYSMSFIFDFFLCFDINEVKLESLLSCKLLHVLPNVGPN